MPKQKKRPRNPKIYKSIKQLKKDMKSLKKESKHERSVKDDKFITAVSSSTGNLINLFETAQGNDYENRDGLSIIAKSIHCNGLIQRMDSTNIVRIMVVQFESSADNSIANFLQDPNGDVNFLYQGVYSPYKINGDCKYRVLKDKRYKVDAQNEFAVVDFKVKVPQKTNVMKYTSTGSQIPQSNPITIFAVSDSQAPNHPLVHMTVRQRFTR